MCVCVCVSVCALRIFSTDKILHFLNTLIIVNCYQHMAPSAMICMKEDKYCVKYKQQSHPNMGLSAWICTTEDKHRVKYKQEQEVSKSC